jgi:hypothetical protein
MQNITSQPCTKVDWLHSKVDHLQMLFNPPDQPKYGRPKADAKSHPPSEPSGRRSPQRLWPFAGPCMKSSINGSCGLKLRMLSELVVLWPNNHNTRKDIKAALYRPDFDTSHFFHPIFAGQRTYCIVFAMPSFTFATSAFATAFPAGPVCEYSTVRVCLYY